MSRETKLESRLLAKIAPMMDDRGCWEWMGSHSSNGYACLSVNDKTQSAHRIMYLVFIGPISIDLEIDHLCFNRMCVNPTHLEAVSHQLNAHRRSYRKSTCPQGHTYDKRDSRQRLCSACARARYHKGKLKIRGSEEHQKLLEVEA